MLSLKNLYFFQAGIGILANAFLFLFHIFTIHQNHRPKPNDVTTCHLAFVHIVMLLTTLDILSTNMFKSLNFPNDLKCKALFYLVRVMRGLSICTTCLLSIIQVITISPSTFYLSRFKQKLTKYIFHAFLCVWSLNLSSNSNMIIYTVAHSNMTNLLSISKYCSLSSMNPIILKIFFTLALSQNIFFVGLMLLSSVYMVIFLSSHQRKSAYLHSMSIFPRTSPAKRATQTVLLLVSFFVIVYCLDIIISSSSAILGKYNPVVLDVQRLVGNIYATVSPLVFISSDKRITGIL
ncbi:vomeronasal 1 receptor oryCunV1R1596 [Oryctolagus cuniculus]|uniref:Vomeronasal type-1 receptor n=1 Tax=Oryctolagus cuniculus TaxID=9986 RepID=G1U0M8_RABIT|nr:vomeronasal 1 receptor oryCunV1R1596 [Oryctolagus cuniculus]XP_051690397.1 vomeronasal 1 receptor oryCunV1R1596 isoform X1 [Oryctolagus cuniculus]